MKWRNFGRVNLHTRTSKEMNVFKYGWMSWRHPINWWGNIKLFFRQFKWAWQRATRGFADCDVWNLDGSILNYLSGTLKQLSETAAGWPGNNQFPEYEDWTIFLKQMSEKFAAADESNDYYPTPIADKWWKWMEEHKGSLEEDPYKELMFEEYNENDLKRERDFAEAWSAIGEVMWDLWD